jgi:hypothetical protein
VEQWVELAYADVPPRMWPLAQRSSLIAHVERIRAKAGVVNGAEVRCYVTVVVLGAVGLLRQ